MSKRTENIIEILRKHHKGERSKDQSISSFTKEAQSITKAWQKELSENVLNLSFEKRVSRDSSEKIDVVDDKYGVAYELKVSGNNPHHEFYKDLIKVMTYNCHQKNKEKRIKKLLFITEKTGVELLKNRLDKKFTQMLKSTHGIKIELVEI